MCCPVISLAKKLISIPSISPYDLGCQKIISERLLKIGFNVISFKNNNTNNLWAYRGYGKTLSFAGHTDVVPIGNINSWIHDPFKPIIKNGFLFGRGSADMKGSLAAMIIAAEKFILSRPVYTGRLSFLITSDEESNADDGTVRIVEYLQSIHETIDYCIIGEPTSHKCLGDTIKIGRRGSLHANLHIYGVQGHIAYPELAINPIHLSIPFFQSIINTKWSLGNKYFQPTSIQISNINAGLNSDNIIPGELRVKFNFRFGTDITSQMIQDKVKKLLNNFFINYKMKWKLSGQPFLKYSNNFVQNVKLSIKKFTNVNNINVSTDGGTSDGRFIKDIAAELIELGPINNTIHKVNECVRVKDLQSLSLVYEDIMRRILTSSIC